MSKKKEVVEKIDPVLASLQVARDENQKKAISYFYGEIEQKQKKGCFRKEQFGTKYSDKDYVDLVEYHVNMLGLDAKSLEALGIDYSEVQEIPPVTLRGYYYGKINNTETVARRGDDNCWRSSGYQITRLFFSNKQMFAYTIMFDTRTNEKLEETAEIFYKDIVSFNAVTEKDEKEVEKTTKKGCLKKASSSIEYELVEYQSFRLCVKGDVVKYSMNSSEERKQVLQALKAKIREQK